MFLKPYLSFSSVLFRVCISLEVVCLFHPFFFNLGVCVFLYVVLYSGWLVGWLLVHIFPKEIEKKKAWNYKGEKVEMI